MGSEVEPAKQLLPYLQRADELQKHEPLVAYYCRLFAMEKGLKIPNKDRTKTTNSLLVSLMNQLEKDKKSIKLSSEDNLYLEGFASNVFAKADRQDRAGRADLNTAKTFYAASIFFEILNQFGEAQPDIEQKQKYALWKAADIRKALKEGRKPEPGPPGGEDDLSIPSTQEPKSSEGDQYARYESFSAGPPGPEISSQHPQDTIPHSHATPPAPPSVHSGSDFDSAGLHRSPVSRHDDSAYQQPYQHQTQPSESVGLHGSPVSRHDDSAYQQPYQHQTQPSESVGLHGSPVSRHDDSAYQQPYQHQTQPSEPHVSPLFSSHEDTLPRTYSHEQQPPNVPFEPSPTRYPHESSPLQYSYPSFQTYPSFSESSLPTVPGHYSPYYQGPESTHLQQPPPPQNYMSSVQYDAGSGDGSHVGHAPLSAAPPAPNQQYSIGSANGSRAGQAQTSAASNPSYTYDSNYQPPVEKIAEAHKAARFAVGALAFDDVPVAVEFLRKSLELLTNPKAEIH